MIKIKNLCKTFSSETGNVNAVENISLEINEGDIYGIIGYSGAGKSTLVRCINLLEVPTSGEITIDGFGTVFSDKEKNLSSKKLRELRQGIGMIFQHFNLLDRSTVFENIAYSLKYTGRSRQEIRDRVYELLELVDLKDKANAYPEQLSGGQKQRVAIARALANNPKILLSDEATSALDPDATGSILGLLKDINKKLGLTIVMITHEMEVIKKICNRVTVMEDGRSVEEGSVYELFSKPRQEISKKFVEKYDDETGLKTVFGNYRFVPGPGQRMYKFIFDDRSVNEDLVSDLSKHFEVSINILLANIEWLQGKPLGQMIVVIKGKDEVIDEVIKYTDSRNVRTEVIDDELASKFNA